MNEIQNHDARDIRPSWLLGGMSNADSQVRTTPQADPHIHAINTRNWARLTAAMLYLIATGFFGVIMSVLATSWGKDGLNQVLAADNVARPAVIYMLVAGGFSLAASFLLLSPVLLPKPVRILLLVFACMVMLAGFVFAVPSVVVSMVPLLFLFRFHQEVTQPVSISADALRNGGCEEMGSGSI